MSPDRTRIKRHRYYDPDVEKVVPKDAVVLDLADVARVLYDLKWAIDTTGSPARYERLTRLRSQIEAGGQS